MKQIVVIIFIFTHLLCMPPCLITQDYLINIENGQLESVAVEDAETDYAALVSHVASSWNDGLTNVFQKYKPLVFTRNGVVKGRKERAVHTGKEYYAYSGIPFAKPPVGELRFEPPQPVESWFHVLDATKEKDICVQSRSTMAKTQKIVGSEDCLYLNIYTPVPPGLRGALPVMVWIYGGASIEGDTSYELYAPDYLINEEVIIVAIAYRLGIFGFFSTGDLTAPGNNGLKDQIMGLRWIKDNIDAFGGDPNKVTIFGESAGGASVSFLTQTPLTKGLYHCAIMQSGVSHNVWAISTLAPEVNRDTAALLGFTFASSADLKQKFKSINYKDLSAMSTLASFRLQRRRPLRGLAIKPVIEPEHPNAVVTKRSFEVLRSGDFNLTPLMMGYNSMEPIDFTITQTVSSYLARVRLESSSLVPDNFNIRSPQVRKVVGDLIKQYYFGNISAEAFSEEQLLRFFADVYFVINIIEEAQLASTYTDVYLYELSYLGVLGSPLRSNNLGVGHAEDLNYLFYRRTSPKVLDPADVAVSNKMVRLWTNFAKYGDPTPVGDIVLQGVRWPKVHEHFGYLNISENLITGYYPRADAYQFWMNLYAAYRQSD